MSALAIVDTQTEEKPAFHIDSESAANWYLRKLANIEAEKQRIRQQAAQIVAELETDAAGLRHLYEAELQAWAAGELQRRGGRRKTLTLLQGTCAFRTVPPTLRVESPGDALDTARLLGLTREEVDAEAYRRAALEAFKERGELLPGIVRSEEQERFTVRFGKPAAGDLAGEETD